MNPHWRFARPDRCVRIALCASVLCLSTLFCTRPAMAALQAPAATTPATPVAPAQTCALTTAASVTAAGQSFSIATSPHVVVVPTILAGTRTYTLKLSQTGTQHWTATIDGAASPTPDAATIALDGVQLAHDIVLQSSDLSSCATHVVVLQFGSAFPTTAGDPPGTALAVAEGAVSARFTADGSSSDVGIQLVGGAPTGLSFNAAVKASVTSSGLSFPANGASVSIQQNGAPLTTVSLPGGAFPADLTTTCSALAALVQATGTTLQIGVRNATLYNFSLKCNASGSDPTLSAAFSSPRFLKAPVVIQSTLGASGTTFNLGKIPVQDGSTLKDVSVAFVAGTGDTPAAAVITTALDTSVFSTTPVSVQINDDGLKLYGAANSTAVVTGKNPKFTASITDMNCPFDTATLQLARCNGTVQLELPQLAGPLALSFTAKGVTAAGNQDIPLGNDYTLSLTGLSVSLDKELKVAAKSAAIVGGMLGTGGIGVRDLAISSQCVTGAVTAAKSIPAGAFTFANISGKLRSCASPPSQPDISAPSATPTIAPQGLSIIADAKLTLGDKAAPSDALSTFSVALNRLGILIPVNGGRLTVDSPQSVTVTGKLLHRTLVGVCPAALSDPSQNVTGMTALPSVALGQASAAANDIPQAGRFFQVTADGGYELCVGIHITPDSPTGIPPSGTMDLANARLLFTHKSKAKDAVQTTGDIALQTASLNYSGAGISTRLGSNSFGITSLNLTYDAAGAAAPSQLATSSYAGSASIPLLCRARLYGDVTMKIQSLTAVATSTATIDTQLGFGDSCVFADMSGSVSIPVGNNSVYLRELHFGMGPHEKDSGKRVSFVSVTGRVYIGQGGFAFKNSGFTDVGDGARPAFHPDTWGTVGMNVGWIISGIGGFITGTLVK